MINGNILIVDDEPNLRKLLAQLLSLEGYEIFQAKNLSQAREVLHNHELLLVITDVKLPDGNGIELLEEIKSKYPFMEVIVITAFGTIEDGVKAIKLGAFDYITKDDHEEKIMVTIERGMERARLRSQVENLQNKLSQKYGFENLIGNSKQLRDAIKMAKKVAKTDATVLILGDTGTGKEVFAQAIHYTSQRKEKPFVALNCSAFSKELLESELFGHVKGAFTGAVSNKKGYFEEANGGTLFLDEIGDMDLSLQAKILRVLETKSYTKVGDTKTHNTDVRIIAATNKNLVEEIDNKEFRRDLFYRLNSFTINLPGLRDRENDVITIAEHFAKEYAYKMNKPTPELTDEYKKALSAYHWPGNIRELRNIMERSIILMENDQLNSEHLPYHLSQEGNHQAPADISSNSSNHQNLADMEKNFISRILKEKEGNKPEAAKSLGIGLTTLYRKIEKYNIS